MKCAAAWCVAALAAVACARDCPKTAHSEEATLHQDILCNYNTDYRPVKDHKSSVQVKVSFFLKYVAFDTSEETLIVHSNVLVKWKDEYLTWEPAQYQNITTTQVDSSQIWTPSLALFNADATLYQSESFYTTCDLTSDGTVQCMPNVAHTALCSASIRRWPYDTHNCSLYFGTWMHTGEQVNITYADPNPVRLGSYQDGPGWQLTGVQPKWLSNQYQSESYPILVLSLSLRRVSAGLAATVVAPAAALALLTLAALLLDVRDHSRLALACFALFGHFLFLSEIGYEIPKHSDNTPIILVFTRDSMIMAATSVLVTLALMSLRRRAAGGAAAPPRALCALAALARRGPARYVIFTEFDPVLNKVVSTEEVNLSEGNEDTAQASSDWIEIANLFNSCFFILSLLIYTVLICTYIPYS